MNEKEKQTDLLNDVNNQFKELIELIEKTNVVSYSIKEFHQMIKNKKQQTKTKWIMICFILLLICISLYAILLYDELIYNIYFLFLSFIRLILIKILPYWDWTKIYTNLCFIYNPFYNNSMDLSECNKCANTSEILRQSNVTFFNFTKNIYLKHLPVIVNDTTQTWTAIDELTITNLFQLFINDPILSESDLCYFESNIRNYNQPGGADKLFNDYLNGDRQSFIVHWNNCKREALKVIRSYYSKPYFLPPSVSQTLMGNWFLVSAGFNKRTKYFHRIPLNNNWIWLAQIQGSSLVELRTKRSCEKICPVLKSVKLNHGDLIIYSSIYDGFYSPLSKETILLAQGVD